MVTFQQETLYAVIDEIPPLIQTHYDEVTLHKNTMKLAIDWDRYAELERMGKLFIYTARDESKLIGYCAFFVERHIHYKDNDVALNDALFLQQHYRGGEIGGTADQLLDFCEHQLTQNGPVKIVFHVKFSRDFRPLLHRRGYCDEEIICGKIAGVKI